MTLSLLRRLLKPALLLLGVIAVALLLRRFGGGGLPAMATLHDGLRGKALFLLAGTLICAVGLPRQAVCFAGGIAYGVATAILLSSVATVAGCLLGFLWARLGAGGWARRYLERRSDGWLGRFERFVASNPFLSILTIRLLPVGSSLALNLAAGILGVRIMPFLGATLLGSLPQTIIFTLLGSGARIGHTTQIVVAVLLFVASGALGLLLLRGHGRSVA